ncbi:MAG: DUF4198 domain-containing protein [Polyangiaceae bacterium]|nr:DUF4198 domain-containing protein [Polyangiaceae bacterium]
MKTLLLVLLGGCSLFGCSSTDEHLFEISGRVYRASDGEPVADTNGELQITLNSSRTDHEEIDPKDTLFETDANGEFVLTVPVIDRTSASKIRLEQVHALLDTCRQAQFAGVRTERFDGGGTIQATYEFEIDFSACSENDSPSEE